MNLMHRPDVNTERIQLEKFATQSSRGSKHIILMETLRLAD